MMDGDQRTRLQQNRFGQMSDTIIGRVDEMSSRIDDLEKSIQDLMVQASFVAG